MSRHPESNPRSDLEQAIEAKLNALSESPMKSGQAKTGATVIPTMRAIPLFLTEEDRHNNIRLFEEASKWDEAALVGIASGVDVGSERFKLITVDLPPSSSGNLNYVRTLLFLARDEEIADITITDNRPTGNGEETRPEIINYRFASDSDFELLKDLVVAGRFIISAKELE